MYWTEKHALVCTASHCSQKGASEVAGKLRLEMVRRGLDKRIMVNNCGTIDLCDCGPNIIVYPDNIIYSGVTSKDIPEIIAHLQGGPVVERLVLDAGSPGEVNRRQFYEQIIAAGASTSRQAFTETAASFGLDEHWVAEQIRRGFVARRDNAELGEQIVITSKATNRYGLAT